MERNIKKELDTAVIEYLGTPGSGKSTLAHLHAKLLKSNELKVDEMSYVIGNEAKKYYRILIKLTYTIIFNIKHPLYIYNIFNSLPQNSFNTLIEFFKQLVNICFVISQYEVKNNNITIIDQGIAQASISLMMNCNNDNNEINELFMKLLSIVDRKIYLIYVKTDENVALSRINKRLNGASRIDKMNCKQDQLNALKKISKLCDKLKEINIINIIEVDNNDEGNLMEKVNYIQDSIIKSTKF